MNSLNKSSYEGHLRERVGCRCPHRNGSDVRTAPPRDAIGMVAPTEVTAAEMQAETEAEKQGEP